MRPNRIAIAVVAISLIAAGCGGGGGARGNSELTASGTFGNLTGICRPGDAESASAQGVTANEIEIGTFTDVGFTRNPDFLDAAKVFTSWCNAAGGINGRKIVTNVRDTNLTEVRQRMAEACREDFFLVGGSAALDGLGVKDRLSCLLPEFPAQATTAENAGSDLQLGSGATIAEGVDPYSGFHDWLITEAHPASADAVGLLVGDSPITEVMSEKLTESLTASGAKVVYNEKYPPTGISDWTPYAREIRAERVRGLIFLGEFRYLAELQDTLTEMNYELDWIDANANSYSSEYLGRTRGSLDSRNNYVDLSGIAPLDAAAKVPAVRQLKDLFDQYAPSRDITFQVLRAFQAWLLFAKSAASCGDQLTRTCVFTAARRETAWTAGGLQAPVDLSRPLAEQTRCFNVQQATPEGWKAADFAPNTGVFRCGFTPYKYTQDFGRPTTLADVGKSMSDLK
ncbi:ABC transporter substrate-binding protein [Nocardia sp. NPDC005366]|uniref:ABC transporter substrate-binding protein n=1 Tax=Nocardia sp. NPDC005366 TaxID=3156878 RepID=UPI0033AD6D8F